MKDYAKFLQVVAINRHSLVYTTFSVPTPLSENYNMRVLFIMCNINILFMHIYVNKTTKHLCTSQQW